MSIADQQQYQDLVGSTSRETVRRIHEEAFARLSDDEREAAFEALRSQAPRPEDEPPDASPSALAEIATRRELGEPGILAKLLERRDGERDLFAVFAGYAIASEAAFAALTLPTIVYTGDGGNPWFIPGFGAVDDGI